MNFVKIATIPFSIKRAVLAKFDIAHALLLDTLRENSYLKHLFLKSFYFVIQQIGDIEEGLTDIEVRAMRIADKQVQKKVVIVEHNQSLSIQDALQLSGEIKR